MSQATSQDGSALAGMSEPLADRFQRWYPYIRSSVRDTVARIGGRGYLAEVLGQDVSDQQAGMLDDAWFAPYESYHDRGGKMLRPFLVCLCVEAHGGDPMAIPGLVALPELVHVASLVLDDNADDSPLRRGGPTVPRMVGVRVSSAMASAWLNVCFEVLAGEDLGISREAADELIDRIAWEHWVTGIGTTIDTTWPWLGRFDHEPGQYLQSVTHRTGSYSFRLPLTVGAVAAGASAEHRRRWEDLGEEIGLAFQIYDDILGVRRQDDRWGKQVAEDLTQGKVNLQVLEAVRAADAADRSRLIEILTSHTEDSEALKEAIAIMDRTGAFDAAAEAATARIGHARHLVDGMDFIAAGHRALLHDFIDYMLKRTL